MALEYINAHTLPCGCRFLLAWEETRVRDPASPPNRPVWIDNLPQGQDRQYRIVTQDEAEAVVNAKRAHPDWAAHVVGTGNQPQQYLCPVHAALPYNKGGYLQVIADNNPNP